MRRLFYTICLFLIYCAGGFSQSTEPYSTLQRVIPASPEAISLGQVGFADANLYTGKASYSIPIYTISQKGISFPVSLSYTGGGGIKVEEVGSSVGLGWNLSSTGVVSRVIRGVADDNHVSNYIGYMHMPDFPPLDTAHYEDYKKYAKNQSDGQPDLFSLSVAGMSAQFYINRNKKVVFVEKSDLKITPIFSDYSIVAFEAKDLSGKSYYFSELEKSKSEPIIENYFPEYTDYFTTSWYLTKISSEYGKEIIRFTYLSGESNLIKQSLRSPMQYKLDGTDSYFVEDATSYSNVYYKRPILQKISFASGEVNFKMSDESRYDMGDDEYLQSVTAKNYLGDTVARFEFHYSYFTPTGSIPLNEGTYSAFGNPELRLKLDSIQNVSRNNHRLTYKFIYHTDHYLPDRMSSFAMDHWGYFNGEEENEGWEAKNRVKYYGKMLPLTATDSVLKELGSADREPRLTYSKAGVLSKVITPTGGELQFNYELNSSADPTLHNTITSPSTWYYPTTSFSTDYFTVNLITEPFAFVRVTSNISSGSYSYEYFIKDSLQTRTIVHDTLVSGDANHQYMLEPGNYCIIQKRLGANSDTAYLYYTRLYKDIETLVLNKPVGGLRIRSMQLVDSVAGTNLQRNYFYNESGDTSNTSLSTGEIAGIPQYGLQYVELWSTDYVPNFFSPAFIIPKGYIRLLSSAYPVGVTSGSFVGYKKVTVVDSNELKTESHFTSFKDFPEFSEGYFKDHDPSLDNLTINGRSYETYPFAPFDERDFLRGKLKKQIIYRKESGQFYKIQQTENFYDFNMGLRIKKNVIVLPDTIELITGMASNLIHNPSDPNSPILKFKMYNLYTSKYDLKKTIEKTYTYQGGIDSLVTETNLEYGDSPWFRDSLYHYQPTKITKTHSTGKEVTKIYYPYDWRYGVPDTTSGEMTNMKILDTSNRIAMPVLHVVTDSATNNHVASVKNTYSTLANSKLAVNLIKTKQGSASSFDDKISFNRYDTSGNLIEQQKVNDIKSSYIWDYKNSYPVAEVNNADSASIAYTSFEAENKGNWSYSGSNMDTVAVTGRRAYKLNGSNGLSKSGLSSGTVYLLSYWTRNGSAFSITGTQSPSPITGRTVSGWTYYEHKITGQTTVTLSGNGWVDEVRLYPMDAQMATLTYEPLLGISSQCDANNRISYYEYDAFGRLSIVRDQDRNVIKRVRYNYTGQPETDYYYYNTSQSNSFTRSCGEGYVGSTVTYSVSANIYSSSISQADANKKALNDITANGQNYANAVGTCTVVCNSGNCTGVNKKCINNTCETGVKVNTDSYWVAGMNKWACVYHYEWSDASWSSNYISYSNFACPY